MIITSIYPNI